MKKKVSNQTLSEIKQFGHGVPRNDARYIVPFRVGGRYIIFSDEDEAGISVKCTQDNPTHLVKL
jgi:hypothetical protein